MMCFHWLSHKVSRYCILILFMLAIGSRNESAFASAHQQISGASGKLFYDVYEAVDGPQSFMVYDVGSGERTQITSIGVTSSFAFSNDGRLAYASQRNGKSTIFILDTSSADPVSTQISELPEADDYAPAAWSPDSRYLAFIAVPRVGQPQLYVWDGTTATNINPENLGTGYGYSVVWSNDGQLAFTQTAPHEIYLWDGKRTTNLSQNATADDHHPVWSNDGKLAFVSDRDGKENSIYVWDGVSFKDGVPDAATFTSVPPELTNFDTHVDWTSAGLLAFRASDLQSRHIQIYTWDAQKATATNISQNPTMNNGGPQWIADGRWTFTTFWSAENLVYVRDADNNTIYTARGMFPSLSPQGNLMYCTQTPQESVLYVWNGQQEIEIARGFTVRGQWQGGATTFCTSYSG